MSAATDRLLLSALLDCEQLRVGNGFGTNIHKNYNQTNEKRKVMESKTTVRCGHDARAEGLGNKPQTAQVFAPLATATTLLFGRIVPASFALAGALFLVTGIRHLNRGWTSEAWPSVTGTIVSSDVQAVSRRDSDGHSDTNYRVVVRYTYNVLDEEYTGTRIRFGAISHNEHSTAQEEKRCYPSGKRVEVFYDPESPSTAVLTKGVGGGVWVTIGLGGVFVVIGMILFVYLPRAMAKRLTAAEL